MLNLYKDELAIVDSLDSYTDKHMHLLTIFRSLMQTLSLSLLHIADDLVDELPSELTNMVSRFDKPSDGLPREMIEFILPVISSYKNGISFNDWFKKKYNGKSLSQLVLIEIEKRNTSFHGAPNKLVFQSNCDALRTTILECLSTFSKALPKIKNTETVIKIFDKEIKLSIPLVINNKCVVISRVKKTDSKFIFSLSIVDWLSEVTNNTLNIDVAEDNLLNLDIYSPLDRFNFAEQILNVETNLFMHNLPKRQTDYFYGRSKELNELKDWIEDLDERSCLIFGDGGYGKTTLLLEFFNRIINNEINISIKIPFIVSFHTAKLTEWNDKGISYNRSVSKSVEDGIREILYVIHKKLDKSWFETEGNALISKIETELKNNKINKNEVLIIIDNTETLASNKNEIELLGRYFTQVSKKIGRLILTSRRRELLSAHPIEISQLSESDSIDLIRALAKDYNANAISQAGDPKLKKICFQLNYKPLLIDSLVKYISRTQCSIDTALDDIYRKSNDELLEFLYEDAWQRMDEKNKKIFIVLSSLNYPIDSTSIGFCCQELEFQHSEFEKSLDETYFVHRNDYGNKYELSLVELAKRFFLLKKTKYSEDEIIEINKIQGVVESKYIKYKEVDNKYYEAVERVHEAFKCQYAKEAKIHVDRKEIPEAIECFEYAIIEDPMNAYLHERYAFFLYTNHNASKVDKERANEVIEVALKLDNKNEEVLLTAAIINYRNYNVTKGDELIDESVKYGKPLSYSYQVKSIARYHYIRYYVGEKSIGFLKSVLSECEDYMKKANKELSENTPYYKKNRRIINKFLTERIPALRYELRANSK